jgi:predicted ArsR family transcriptional regulator
VTRAEKHDQALAKTRAALAKPMTTKEAAAALETTIPTIVAHIQELRRRGVAFKETRVRLSFHGAPAVRYQAT